MSDEIENHIESIEAFYRPLITGKGSRLEGGGRLWSQFTVAVAVYRKHGNSKVGAIIERVNELAVARIILSDESLMPGRILYEPKITADGRRIDFVVPAMEGERFCLYIEVKTVRPTAEDSTDNWKKYEGRKKFHPKNVTFHVDRQLLGAQIYSNSFSARSQFMQYAREFEIRLAEANTLQPGRGLLVFCGSGFEWHYSELEDFADFYRTGRHRQDDPFANMEADALRKAASNLERNIAAFGFVKRPVTSTTEEQWIANVQGPVVTGIRGRNRDEPQATPTKAADKPKQKRKG